MLVRLGLALVALLVVATRRVQCASDDETRLVPSRAQDEKWFNDRVPYMIIKYQFRYSNGEPWSEATYMHNVRRAVEEIDKIGYYRTNWNSLQDKGVSMLAAEGSLHPSLLPKHPAYSGWVAPNFGERGPMYHKKVFEINPHNPLGWNNPDIAVFAHAQQIYDYTKTRYQTLLYSIKRADRRHLSHRSDRIGQYYNPERADTLPEGWSWSHQVPSRLKMRSLDTFEQFGYDPRGFFRNLAKHVEQNDPSRYRDYSTRQTYLRNAQSYMTQFDQRSARKRFYQYAWTTIRTDDPQRLHAIDVWYQTPLLDMYSNDRIWMSEYGPSEHRKPNLDRVRFVPRVGERGKVHLVPVGIVRPIDVTHSHREAMLFRTVQRMTPEEQTAYSVTFRSYRPRSTNRHVSGRTNHRFDMRNEEVGRPRGHPFTLFPYIPVPPTEEDVPIDEDDGARNAGNIAGSGMDELLEHARQKKPWQIIGAQGESSASTSVLSNLEQHLNPSSELFHYTHP